MEEEEIATPAVPVGFHLIDGSSNRWQWRGESSNRSQSRGERGQIETRSRRKKTWAAPLVGRYHCSRCNQPQSRGESMTTPAAAGATTKCRCSRRGSRLERAWTPTEDERLRLLAKENLFKRWRKVARGMPGRSRDSCRARWRHHLARDVYHRPFTAHDDEELVRLHRHTGGSWRKISRSVYGRTSRIMKNRWIELRRRGLVPAAARTDSCCPPQAAADSESMGIEAESESPPQQHPLADVLASRLDSCTLASDATDPRDDILALDFAFMSV